MQFAYYFLLYHNLINEFFENESSWNLKIIVFTNKILLRSSQLMFARDRILQISFYISIHDNISDNKLFFKKSRDSGIFIVTR
jgi:hypothetical protein